jgi:ribosomal protein S18 acetylase RimI-like enzyme
MPITFRPITNADQPFLYQVYAGTREDEMALLNWSETEKEAFLAMQFSAQHRHYMEHFSRASFDLILLDDQPIGRLYLDRRPDEFRIIDIALLPDFRRQGIGSGILEDILAEAGEARLPVRIHVERNNPALGLYFRLGFQQIEDQGVYYLMEWTPKQR